MATRPFIFRMARNEYEIIIQRLSVAHRPVDIYEAAVFKVWSLNGVLIKDCIGIIDVGFHDSPDKEKVLKGAMALIESDRIASTMLATCP